MIETSSKPHIVLKKLTKLYNVGGEVIKALDEVDLEIAHGEIVALTGPSGSGKSTLMHMIGGLDRPTDGEVIVNGMNLEKLSQSKLAKYRSSYVGFIFQSFNLIPTVNALENVLLPTIFNNSSNHRSNIYLAKKILENIGLEDRIKNKPNQLSGGQKQRVAIARALINSPKIILADEPTGNLDSKTGMEVMQILKNLNSELGVTLIIVTHDNEIASHCHRIIKIKDGKLVK